MAFHVILLSLFLVGGKALSRPLIRREVVVGTIGSNSLQVSLIAQDEADAVDDHSKDSFPAGWIHNFPLSVLAASQTSADQQSARVKDAMRFCWKGYKAAGAFGSDSVDPLSGHHGNWARLGINVLESLDTLHLMGLDEEFAEADAFVRDKLVLTNPTHEVQTMEITIRALGGLLSAYSLTERPEFLEKAQALGQQILHGAYRFDASDESKPQTLLPSPTISLMRERSSFGGGSEIYTAEAGTLQLEFNELSALTGDPVFQRVSGKTISAILDAMERDKRSLFTDTVRSDGDRIEFVGARQSLGARGDSFLEYLIKQAVQDPSASRYRTFSRRILDGVFDNLVQKTKKGTTFIAELNNNQLNYQMDHLVCFLPGVLMLASHHFPKEEVDPRWTPLAESLTETCHKMYTLTDSHLAPEFTKFDMAAEGDQPDMIVPAAAPWNLLRPEAVEAMFYMHYYTGDPKYRQWAGEVLNAFEDHSKGKFGFTSVDDVRDSHPKQRDSQESFFLAETLKYLYLVFAKPDTLDLDKFVLNTEAHPLKITSPKI